MKILARKQMKGFKGGLFAPGGIGDVAGCSTCKVTKADGSTLNASCTEHKSTVQIPGGGSVTTHYCTCNVSGGTGCVYSSN